MSHPAQTKKLAHVAANDGKVPQTAWRAPQQQRQQQGVVPPALRLIKMKQQQAGRVCL